MNDEKKVDILNRVLHSTVNSIVQYIEISTPYIPEGHAEQFETVKQLKAAEIETANRIVALINELDGVPKVGVFPYWNVDLNYLDFRFLARFGAQHLEGAIRELEKELGAVRDDPRVYGLLEAVLEEKRSHLATLRGIGPQPAAAKGDG